MGSVMDDVLQIGVGTPRELTEDLPMKKLEKGKHYVVGFAFDTVYHHVLLISKKKPADQVGKLNGVGGKVEDEDNADPQIAMGREFMEEVGIITDPASWIPFCVIKDSRGWDITFFFTTCDIWSAEQKTDEQPVITSLEILNAKVYPVIPNLTWLIPMALTKVPELPTTQFKETAEMFIIQELPIRA